MTVRLLLFGSPTVEHGGAPYALPFERRSQLLVLLALKRAWVARADLAAMLWPEQESKLAYGNLRKTLFRLQSWPWAERIETHGGALRFEVDTDVAAFEAALRERRHADAAALHRADLLAGFDDGANEAWSSWLGFERDRLRAAWRGAALEQLAADIDPAEGVDLSARLLEADPLDEAALRAHMACLVRSGQSARARQAYREFVDRLAHDLGLAPSAELKALHDALGTTVVVPVLARTAPLSSDEGFVGRTVELRRIGELLAQDGCRLLSIVGPGGVGKTRLARRALHELASGYADGAAFVPLEDLVTPGELGGRLARELGVALSGSGDPLEQVIEFLRERRTLLVLDNFEQFAADTTPVERLLAACQRVKLIVTSRVRLALAAEWLLPLDGLPCPEIEDQDRLEAFDAARLFVQAAQRVEPALIPAAEAESIVDICRQVGGLPLALELAAAWTRVLSCDAIAAELRQGTELLRAADPAHPPRHASIEAVFEQSWKLLGATERDALARLSVFRGGFTAEAARAVAGASLPVLGALADKSLLRKDGARLHMHPLVHQLAALRLGEGGARESAERAHASHFHRLLSQLGPAVENGDRTALDRVDIEFENCRAAWQWAIDNKAGGALRQTVQTVMDFCNHRGRFKTGLSLLREALDSSFAGADAKLELALRSGAAHLLFRLDSYGEAAEQATQALGVAKREKDHRAQALCLATLGACALRRGRHVDAGSYFEQALKEAQLAGDSRRAAALLHNRALVQRAIGRRDDARRLLIESMAAYKSLGDVSGEAMCLTTLSSLHWDSGELGIAIEHLKAALVICDRHGLDRTRTVILSNLAALAFKTGDFAGAATYAERAHEMAKAIGNRHFQSWMRLLFAQLALRNRDFSAARSDLKTALELALAIGQKSVLLEGISCFAEVLAVQGDTVSAHRVLNFVATHPAMAAPDRNEVLARMAQWAPTTKSEPAWPGLSLDELGHRIVVETDVGYGPLIAALRGASPSGAS
ncbi:MAG: SARP family transcriptional regulator [Betaproteobacteria bacterium]